MSLLCRHTDCGILLLVFGLDVSAGLHEALRKLQLPVVRGDQERGKQLISGAFDVGPSVEENVDSLCKCMGGWNRTRQPLTLRCSLDGFISQSSGY